VIHRPNEFHIEPKVQEPLVDALFDAQRAVRSCPGQHQACIMHDMTCEAKLKPAVWEEVKTSTYASARTWRQLKPQPGVDLFSLSISHA
jgi:hypothetical protein